MNPPTLPVTIHRSWLGEFLIILGGVIVESIIFGGAYLLAINHADPNIIYLFSIFGLGVLVWVLVALIVYELSYLRLTEEGIYVKNFRSLFWHDQALIDWADIEEVSTKTAGVLVGLFGVGTLYVQTASAIPNVSLTYVPRATYWARYIQSKQVSTPVLTHNV